MKKIVRKIGIIIIPALFWLAVWFIVAKVTDNSLIIPKPLEVLKTLGKLMITWDFYKRILISLAGILAGFISANVLGILIGALCAWKKAFKIIFEPAISAVKATPVMSFIILILIWFGKGLTPVITSFLIVLPVVFQSVVTGSTQYDKNLLEVGKIYRFSSWKKLRNIYIPAVFPHYMSAFKTGIGMSWKAGIAAEVLANGRETIGSAIYNSKIYLETTELFAWTLVVIVLSIIIEKLSVKLLEKIMPEVKK